jgi:hypothetical protein
MKPSKRYEWLLLYSLVWTMIVLSALWLWGDAVVLSESRLLASAILVVGDLLIAAYIWWRFEPNGKKKEPKNGAPAGSPGAPGAPGGPGRQAPTATSTSVAAAQVAAGKPVSQVKAS